MYDDPNGVIDKYKIKLSEVERDRVLKFVTVAKSLSFEPFDWDDLCKRFPCPPPLKPCPDESCVLNPNYRWFVRAIIDISYRDRLLTDSTRDAAIAEMTKGIDRELFQKIRNFAQSPEAKAELKMLGDMVCGIWTCP
jgi:hypothetical protein